MLGAPVAIWPDSPRLALRVGAEWAGPLHAAWLARARAALAWVMSWILVGRARRAFDRELGRRPDTRVDRSRTPATVLPHPMSALSGRPRASTTPVASV